MRTPIVIDANVLLSAALKRGFTYQILLKLLLSKEYDLYIPQFLKEELFPKLRRIALKKGIPYEELRTAITFIALSLHEVKREAYKDFLPKALSLVHDPSDAPYVATALYLTQTYQNTTILTFNKKDFKVKSLKKQSIHILTPAELTPQHTPF